MSRKQIAAQLGQVPVGPAPTMDYQAQLEDIARRRQIAAQMAQPSERISQAGAYIVPPNSTVMENDKPIFTNTVQPKPASLPAGMRLDANGEPEWIPGYIAGRKEMSPSGVNQLADDESRLGSELYQAGVPLPQGGR